MRRPHRSPRLATLCLQAGTADTTKDNAVRISVLEETITHIIASNWHPLDAILLPGGFFRLSRTLGALPFDQRKNVIEGERFAAAIKRLLQRLEGEGTHAPLIFGVTAAPRQRAERTEQACIAFDGRGAIGVARKMFPTSAETRGRRYMSPCVADYSAEERFISLPNGSVAMLNSCYDLFGAADTARGGDARRLAIRALRQGPAHITHRDAAFRATRDAAIATWKEMVAQRQPDVLMASIHAFERPGLDGYWQRHGIARASAAFQGALAIGAAHFLDALPTLGSPLAAARVPRAALTAGVNRAAYALPPTDHLSWTTKAGINALLRLFVPTKPTSQTRR